MDKAGAASTEPKKINKAAILYTFIGVGASILLASTFIDFIPERKKNRGRSTITVPDPPAYDVTYAEPEEEVREFPVEEAPSGAVELPHLGPEAGEAPVPPPAPAPVPAPALRKAKGFVPDFSTRAARSAMAVPVGGNDQSQQGGLLSSFAGGLPTAALRTSQASQYSSPPSRNPAQSSPYSSPTSQFQLPEAFGGASGNRNPSEYELFGQANQQDQKNAFTAQQAGSGVTDRLGPHSVAQGTVIPAVLLTGLNTDLPGYIMAQVSENVYDFVSGENLLIPAGSRLVAAYNSVVSWGQRRIQISWQELIRPDGTVVSLGGAPGIDAAGLSGVGADVNSHVLEILGGIGFSALTTFLTGASNTAIDRLLRAGALSTSFEEVVAKLGTIGYTIADRWLNVQPTLTLDSGSKVNVFVLRKITLTPAGKAGKTQKYRR